MIEIRKARRKGTIRKCVACGRPIDSEGVGIHITWNYKSSSWVHFRCMESAMLSYAHDHFIDEEENVENG